MRFSKAAQVRSRGRKRLAKVGYTGPESDLQEYLDKLLAQLGVWNIHIHSGVFERLPPSIRAQYSGIPDALMFAQLTDKYMLCAPVELKNRDGKLHGKQKTWAEQGISYQLGRSFEDIEQIVIQFLKDAREWRARCENWPTINERGLGVANQVQSPTEES